MTDSDRRSLLQALNAASPVSEEGSLFLKNSSRYHVIGNASLVNANSTSYLGSAIVGATSSSASSTSVLFNSSAPWRNASSSPASTDSEEYHYWVLVMLLVPALTIFGNILVVLAVCRERSLQSATNYFIVSLAFADILVAAIVMPVSVIVEVRNGHWDFSDLQCDLWIMCDALFSTASILNLVAISIDRFIAVTQPIKYAKHKNSKRTHVTIAATWLLSIAIALPIGCGLQNMQGLRYNEKFRHVCTFFNGDFLIYSSLGSFYIPCMVMIVLYYRIFKVIRDRAKKANKAKKLPPQSSLHPATATTSLHANHHLAPARRPQSLTTPSTAKRSGSGGADCAIECAACQTDGIYTGDTPVAHTCRLPNMSSPVDSPQQLTESQTLAGPSNSDQSENSAAGNHDNNSTGNNKRSGSASSHHQAQKKQQLFQQLKLRKKSTSKADRSAARREKKATKTLAIVLGVFLLCWLPFFITNLMWAACLKNFNDQESLGVICQYDRRINVFIVWLGYVNSFLNPLIYTIFNTEFRKAFKKLLHIE